MTISPWVTDVVTAVVRDMPHATISDRVAEARRRLTGARSVKRTELRALFAAAARGPRGPRPDQCPFCRQTFDLPGVCIACAPTREANRWFV